MKCGGREGKKGAVARRISRPVQSTRRWIKKTYFPPYPDEKLEDIKNDSVK